MKDMPVLKGIPPVAYLLSFEESRGAVLDTFTEKATAMRMARALSRKGERTVLGLRASGREKALCFKYKAGALIYDGGCCPSQSV